MNHVAHAFSTALRMHSSVSSRRLTTASQPNTSLFHATSAAIAADAWYRSGPFERVCVIGLGYIGLPTAAVLAARGIDVIGVDVNAETVATINQGRIAIVEPDLHALVQAAALKGKLRATQVPEPADAFVIAVPTPLGTGPLGKALQPDLSAIAAAAWAIAPVLVPGNLVVLESTSPVGTTEQLAAWLALARPDLTFPQDAGDACDIRLAYCPERVLPGRALRELVENDRVIGGMTARCSAAAVALYQTFVTGECLVTTARTAEMCKLTENAFRDVNIAFANELSMICARLGISVWDLIGLANHHPRVNILQPGAGVGGHCIAVDPWFIVNATPDLARLIQSARQVNDSKPGWIVERVKAAAEGLLATRGETQPGVVIAVFGLSFKADSDDLRESPAVAIAADLARCFPGRVLAVEPHITALPRPLADLGIELVSQAEALARADVWALLVDHRTFRENRPEQRPGSALIDARGLWGE